MSTDHSRLDGKIAIVTGGTQGLGAAVARRLAEAGAAGVVTCGRGQARGLAVAEAVGRDGAFLLPEVERRARTAGRLGLGGR